MALGEKVRRDFLCVSSNIITIIPLNPHRFVTFSGVFELGSNGAIRQLHSVFISYFPEVWYFPWFQLEDDSISACNHIHRSEILEIQSVSALPRWSKKLQERFNFTRVMFCVFLSSTFTGQIRFALSQVTPRGIQDVVSVVQFFHHICRIFYIEYLFLQGLIQPICS